MVHRKTGEAMIHRKTGEAMVHRKTGEAMVHRKIFLQQTGYQSNRNSSLCVVRTLLCCEVQKRNLKYYIFMSASVLKVVTHLRC
jgi:hypothetical protein